MQVPGTLVRERTVRVADKGTAGGTFAVGYVPASEVPGVSYSFPDGASVTVPPGGTATFRVRLTAVAAEMDGTPDPWLDREVFVTRDTIAEAAGTITLTPSAGAGLRLPLYASLRPVSDMRAEEAEIAVSASAPSAELHLAGTPVDTGPELPRDLVSLVTPFELQAESPALDLPAHQAAADLRYVGVACDARRLAAAAEHFADSSVWFGLASHERWSSPNVVDFRIEIDADLDDAYETTIHNDSGLSDGVDDWFATATLDELCPSCAFFRGPLNSLSADQASTAVFDTDVLVLEAGAWSLGLVEGQPFRYRVTAYARPTGMLIDQVGPLTFDPSAPGLDISGAGFLGRLTTRDLPGETLDVAFDPEAYEADGGLGALLLHHYNGDGARAEVIPLMDDAQPPTSAIAYPAANANILAPAFADGCATPAEDVCGTAEDGADGSGVAKVEVQLRRTTDGLYFDGSGWVADATWIEAAGTGEWTRAFPAAPGYYTIASRATDGAGNVEEPAAPRAFRILPATVDPVVVYTGDQSLVQGATVTLRASLTSPESLVCNPADRPLTFSLDDDPTTATVGDGPYALGSASTNASGVATLTRSTGSWQSGVYTVRVELAAGSGCTAAFDEATLTVAAAGDAASGGGWYTLPNSGRVADRRRNAIAPRIAGRSRKSRLGRRMS